MNIITSINFILEQYILRSTSSISRVIDPRGQVVNPRYGSQYNGPTRGIIRNVDSNNSATIKLAHEQIRRDMSAGKYYRFKSKIKSKKLDN